MNSQTVLIFFFVNGESWSGPGRLSTAVTYELLRMVAGCALGTDVYHWMFLKKVSMVSCQQDSPLTIDVNVKCLKLVMTAKNFHLY